MKDEVGAFCFFVLVVGILSIDMWSLKHVAVVFQRVLLANPDTLQFFPEDFCNFLFRAAFKHFPESTVSSQLLPSGTESDLDGNEHPVMEWRMNMRRMRLRFRQAQGCGHFSRSGTDDSFHAGYQSRTA